MDLSGKLIVAMPALGDPRFERTVILICAHSDEGAMGLIVNKPLPELHFSDLLTQLKIPKSPNGRDIRVHFGGQLCGSDSLAASWSSKRIVAQRPPYRNTATRSSRTIPRST